MRRADGVGLAGCWIAAGIEWGCGGPTSATPGGGSGFKNDAVMPGISHGY